MMRKIYTLIIIGFVIIAGIVFVFFDKSDLSYISILTVNQDRQRLITENEELSITFYISTKDSFLTDVSLITGLYLKGDTEEIEVGLSEIRDLEYTEEFQSVEYYAYCFDINFNELNISNYDMYLENTSLVVNYQNGDNLDLEIGNTYLQFKEIDNPTHINMTRMFATYYQDTNIMSGIVIGIDNLSGFNISINEINIGNQNVGLDLANAKTLTDLPDYNTSIIDILGYEYHSIGNIENNSNIDLSNTQELFIPIKYKVNYFELNRFPLEICYTYNNKEYSYLIDDFMFNTQSLGLEVNNGRIREFIYNY